jgi:hypothetical protein
LAIRTVRVFRQKFTLEDAIGSHACSLEANMRVTNGIPLGSPPLLPVGTVNCVQTLKATPTGNALVDSSNPEGMKSVTDHWHEGHSARFLISCFLTLEAATTILLLLHVLVLVLLDRASV